MPVDERKLQTMLDKQEIHDALMRYCRGIDRCDPQLVLSAFHEDAMDNHTGIELPVAERVPNVMELTKAAVKWTSHNICNELIDVDDDVANSESYLIAYHRVEHEGRELDWILGARYVDRFERRRGSWRIAHRTVVCDWERFEEVGEPPSGLLQATYFDDAEHGTRSRADFSYTRLHGEV